MKSKEFSDSFDAMLNSYNIQTGSNIVLDEYEKSLFLTQAQEQLVIELYTGRNDKGNSFEETEELRAYLKDLIKTEDLIEADNEFITTNKIKGISKHSKFYVLPTDILFITYEATTIDSSTAGCKGGAEIQVIPVTQDEFHRIKNNPFRQPNERKALRLDNGSNIAEIVAKYKIGNYTIRYIKRPDPIILADFDDEVKINNSSSITKCELNPIMHRPILERAVQLALAYKSINRKE